MMADGTVRFFSQNTNLTILGSLQSMAGYEIIGEF